MLYFIRIEKFLATIFSFSIDSPFPCKLQSISNLNFTNKLEMLSIQVFFPSKSNLFLFCSLFHETLFETRNLIYCTKPNRSGRWLFSDFSSRLNLKSIYLMLANCISFQVFFDTNDVFCCFVMVK